jgi:transposase
MLISNEHIRTYYFRSSRTGNHPTLGSRGKLPPAIGTTRPNHSDGSRWNLQPRHSLPLGDFPSYGSTLAAAFFVLPVRRVGKGCTPSRSYPQNFESENQSGGQSHSTDYVSPCDALEYPKHGKSSGTKRSNDTLGMEATQPEAASGQNLQTQPRQALCREVVRHRWIISESSGQIAGSLRGRKESNPGPGQDQPGLPLKKGRCGTMTHDYQRNGTTTLFVALSMLDGKVIGDCMPRHRHQEFIRFLKQIDGKTPFGLDLHLMEDNYGTHKHPQVKSWLKRHPRFHLHFTPTSSSWLNLVERWFREITDKRIRRDSFQNVSALIKAIKDYLENHNQNPKIFVWSAPVERILAKIAKCKEALDALH